MRNIIQCLGSTVAAGALSIGMASPVLADLTAETQQPIKLAEFNIPDADFINHVFGLVLEKAGYNVEYIKADYSAHFTALELGDLDMSPAIWSSTADLIDSTLATGKVENLGSIGVEIREGWWYPAYVEELCPGLPDWHALQDQDCIAALSTAETDGKIRYLGAPPDWSALDEERIKALNISAEIVPPGTSATMVASMKGAIQREKPVIGFGFVPHWLFGSTPGAFVEWPEYDPACNTDPSWGENPDLVGDCGLASGTIYKLAFMESEFRAPNAFELLRRYTISTEAVSVATADIENDGMSADEAANKWLEANQDVWADWLK